MDIKPHHFFVTNQNVSQVLITVKYQKLALNFWKDSWVSLLMLGQIVPNLN